MSRVICSRPRTICLREFVVKQRWNQKSFYKVIYEMSESLNDKNRIDMFFLNDVESFDSRIVTRLEAFKSE